MTLIFSRKYTYNLIGKVFLYSYIRDQPISYCLTILENFSSIKSLVVLQPIFTLWAQCTKKEFQRNRSSGLTTYTLWTFSMHQIVSNVKCFLCSMWCQPSNEMIIYNYKNIYPNYSSKYGHHQISKLRIKTFI